MIIHSPTPAEAPDLRIVRIDEIIPHEIEDAQRAQPLVIRLAREDALKNPPVVTPLKAGDTQYVILDGTNRVTALHQLGYQHIIVQVARYEQPHVELHTWNHVVSGIPTMKAKTLLSSLDSLDIRPADPFRSRADLARRILLAVAITEDGRMLSLSGGGLDLHERTRLLQSLVMSYVNLGHLHRTNLDDPVALKSLYPDMGIAFIFPKYDPAEILDLAAARLPVPPGITRHVIHGRALRINFPLEYLRSEESLEAKNVHLVHWVREQFAQRRVRYYQESTYLFDE